MVKNNKISSLAKERIPGFSQLLSKRPDQFSREFWPSHYKKAKGTFVWDLDGQKYLDMSISGIGANVLGYSDKEVNSAVKKAIEDGSSSSLNPREEVLLADKLCKLHPWADMARFSRSGGEAVSIAVRIARAYSNKDKVLFCGYHGWQDWYLAANISSTSNLDEHLLPSLTSLGVPRALKDTAFPFSYNNIKSFKELFKKYKKSLGAVVMEPIRSEDPIPGFLEEIVTTCKESNIPLIFDEISSGFRIANGGSHMKFGLNPDLAVFAKAMGNGFPISAVIGKKEIMQYAEESFISSTNWTERVGSAAAIACIEKFVEKDVSRKLLFLGKNMQDFWFKMNTTYNLGLEITGIYPLSYFSFKTSNNLKKTYFVEQMLEKNILSSTRYYPNFAQSNCHLDSYFTQAEKVFFDISKLSKSGNLRNKIKGTISKPGFKRFA
mgnify:FL=1